MVTFTNNRAKSIWFPTFAAEIHVRRFKEDRSFVPVVKDDQSVPELEEIFELAAKHQLALQTGRSSVEEYLILIRVTKSADVDKIIVTHVMSIQFG